MNNFRPDSLNPESEQPLTMENMAEKLGFVPTGDMVGIRGEAITAQLAGEAEEAKKLRTLFQDMGQELIETQLKHPDYEKLKLGLALEMAILRRDSGLLELYEVDLDDAMDIADNLGFDREAELIRQTLEDLRISFDEEE
jgi:hypothetical protein